MRVAIVTDPWQLPAGDRIWGTGGWVSPEEREALDWLTLARFLGWDVDVVDLASIGRLEADAVIVATDELGEEGLGAIDELLGRREILVIARASPGAEETALGTRMGAGDPRAGTDVAWTGPGPRMRWRTGSPLAYCPLQPPPGGSSWMEIDGKCVAAAAPTGKGTLVTLGFHPSAARDAGHGLTDAMRRMLTLGVAPPVAWLDLSGTVALRMDDPGGAQNVYSRDWSYAKPGTTVYEDIARILSRRNARITVAYTAGWVDDGDAERGRLVVAGTDAERAPGAVHPSPVVRYEDLDGHLPGTVHNYEAEYRGIAALVEKSLAAVEIHGYTHVHPDARAWAVAPDRYDSVEWFRELGPAAAEHLSSVTSVDHPVALAHAAIERWFGSAPEVLVPPGDEWTNESLERALDAGVDLVDSYYAAVRHGNRLAWTTHVCAPYLDEASASWFESPLPLVGYLHDQDLAVHGTGWLEEGLAAWEAAGATTFTDLRQLGRLARVRPTLSPGSGGIELSVPGPRLLSPATVCFRTRGALPGSVVYEGRTLRVQPEGDAGRVTINPT